jgi:hypothetical protein
VRALHAVGDRVRDLFAETRVVEVDDRVVARPDHASERLPPDAGTAMLELLEVLHRPAVLHKRPRLVEPRRARRVVLVVEELAPESERLEDVHAAERSPEREDPHAPAVGLKRLRE